MSSPGSLERVSSNSLTHIPLDTQPPPTPEITAHPDQMGGPSANTKGDAAPEALTLPVPASWGQKASRAVKAAPGAVANAAIATPGALWSVAKATPGAVRDAAVATPGALWSAAKATKEAAVATPGAILTAVKATPGALWSAGQSAYATSVSSAKAVPGTLANASSTVLEGVKTGGRWVGQQAQRFSTWFSQGMSAIGSWFQKVSPFARKSAPEASVQIPEKADSDSIN